jgi:methylated-DNA-[protein]-cysteine S-methyltransferase
VALRGFTFLRALRALRVEPCMSPPGLTLFETAIGSCGIAWGERGVVGVQLPERSESATRARLQRRYPDAQETSPPPHIQQVIDSIVAVIRGEAREFSAAVLDLDSVPQFHQRVYAVARTIPAGSTLSYGEIAAQLGDRSAAREVGEAMGRNPFPIIVPCHRVLAAGGKLGGFSAAGGVTTKLRLLEIEGAQVGDTPTLFESLPLRARARGR